MPIGDVVRCSAITKATGQPCRQPAVKGFSVCRLHGAGNANRGKRGGRPIVHGRYSKHLPERLAARYREALSDAKLLELRDEIALVGVRQAELITHLDQGAALAHWRAAKVAYEDLMVASKTGDAAALQAILPLLGTALSAGCRDYEVWQEILETTEVRRRLAESEHRRLVAMQSMITTQQAMALLGAITAIIKEHVHDHTTLAAISTSIRALIPDTAGGEPESYS